MDAREVTLDEAKTFAFKELFDNDQETYGMGTYGEFEKAYHELKGASEKKNDN